MNSEVPTSFLFKHIGEAYQVNRKQFEEVRVAETNRRLFERVRAIIKMGTLTSDNIQAEKGSQLDGDVIVITAAAIKFGSQLRPGEQALTRHTDWFPYDDCEIDGIPVRRSIRFKSTEFIKGETKRFRGFEIEGKYTDPDGVTAEHTLAGLMVNPADRIDLLYSFGNQIPFGSDDYKEVVKMIESAEQQLGIEVGQS